MSFVILVFKQVQQLGVYESLSYNDAQIAIAQYKNNRIMSFDRVPCVGEIVRFPSPQGGSSVFFKVDEVHHSPGEPDALSIAAPAPQSVIFLRPLLVQ